MQSERGKFGFDHHFAFLTIWKDRTFCLKACFFGLSRGLFSKKNCAKRTFRSDFVKLGSEIQQKNGRWFVCFVLFVVILCPILWILSCYKKIFANLHNESKSESRNAHSLKTIQAEKDAVLYLNSTMDCFQTVGISRFQSWFILQIFKDAIELTSRQEVHFRQHFFPKRSLVYNVLEHIGFTDPWNWQVWKFKNSNRITKVF